jgi:uncharacterized protein (UPF0264 family)
MKRDLSATRAPAAPLRALVSVRNLGEALLAAQAGVAFIDLKEPRDGALGALPVAAIGPIVAALREAAPGTPVSATIGDWPAAALSVILRQTERVAATGVDYVKAGIEAGPHAAALVEALGRLCRAGLPVVPVLIADHGVADDLLERLGRQGFAAVMLDTADKRGGSLLQRLSAERLAAVIAQLRSQGPLIGLAGALQFNDLPQLRQLRPDFAGFRSAVCAGDRRLGLDALRLHRLLAALAAAPEPLPAGVASPSGAASG